MKLDHGEHKRRDRKEMDFTFYFFFLRNDSTTLHFGQRLQGSLKCVSE
jgi:hypothetical protein